MKKCPYCAEQIQDAAVVCKHCGRNLNPTGVKPAAATNELTRPMKTREVVGALVLGGILLFGYASTQMDGCGPGNTVVTLAEFSALRDGMSYSEAAQLIGAPGTEMSRSSVGGTTTVMYSWTNSGGSNMNAMFQNDKLVNKAQFGLR